MYNHIDNWEDMPILKATMLLKKSLFNNAILRIMLIFSLVYYMPDLSFFYPRVQAEAINDFQEDSENGMGGGIIQESIPVQEEIDLELLGVPESVAYSRPNMLTFSYYSMERGDIIGYIAERSGLNEDTLISVNDIKNTRLMQIGQIVKIPNQDGIYHTVQAGDSLDSLAERYNSSASHISIVNELFSDTLAVNSKLFIPGARMDWVNRQEINGDLFIWPCSGYLTSLYGYRSSPFTGVRQFHSGIDIGAPTGTPVRAAMAGRVSFVGYDDTFGNYIVINHHSGYRTLYAHLSVTRVRAGSYVANGERIGDVGSTGLSTGPHLHFTVYKNGVTVNPRALMK